MLMAALRLNIPDRLRLRRPDGGRQGHRRGQDQDGRSHRRHGRRRRRHVSRRRCRGDGALGLPDLRLLLRHVHRQFDELPDRGARPGAARQRHDRSRPTPTASGCSSRPASSSSISRAAITSRTTPRGCRARIASFEAFENAMTLDIAMGGSTNTVLHLLAAAHEGGGGLHHGRHRPAVAPRAGAVQGRAVRARRASRGRAPRRRHHRHPRRTRSRRAAQPRRADGARASARARRSSAGTSSAPTATASASSSSAAPGGVPTQVAFSQAAPLRGRSTTRPREGRASATPSTPSRRTAGSRCSTATSPRKAAS